MNDQQVILVTGSGSGFGRLTALTLARQGQRVFASLRDAEGRNAAKSAEIRRAAEGEVLPLSVLDLDVADDASVERAVAMVVAHAGRIDALVNNAGIMYTGVAEGFTVEQARAQMETNYVGPLRLDRAVLPHMRRRGQGLLVHVTSVAGGLAFPFLAQYSASKMAVEALAEGYRYELAGLGIDSVIVEPGPFGTSLLGSQEDPRDAERVAAYGPIAEIPARMLRETEEMNAGPDAQDPQLVADAIAVLIAMPAGTRPLRTIPGTVDWGLRALNEAKERAQRTLLEAWGLTDLLTTASPATAHNRSAGHGAATRPGGGAMRTQPGDREGRHADDERYRTGLETLAAVQGEAAAQGIIRVGAVAPELARYAIEAFGDIYANPALDVKTRELATVAALTALGTAPGQLRGHIEGALNVGATRAEIITIVTQMYAYAGFPAALNGLAMASEVLRDRDDAVRGA